MFNFLKQYRFRISISLLLIAFFLVLVGQLEKGRMQNWFVTTISTLVYPFQAGGDWVVNSSIELWTHYIWLIDTAKDNEALKKELIRLQGEQAAMQEIQQAYRRMMSLLQFGNENPDLKIFAQVIGEKKDAFSRLLILNRGTQAGIHKNFAVVTPQGVVGKIQSVTPFQSVVQLITDSRSHFPTLLQRTRLKSMVQGDLDGSLIIANFPRRMSIKLGDKVITSGLAGIFPKSLPLGIVSEIEKKDFGLFQKITLTPAVNLDQLEEVAVILYSKGNIHQPLFTTEPAR